MMVSHILSHIDNYVNAIQTLLVKQTYQPAPYIEKIIKDGATHKERKIYKPKYYPDQIIHWALMLQIQPIIMRGMYAYSCGSVPGRGSSLGQKKIREYLDKDYKGTKYCLKMDISKFYPSIQNEILKAKFRRIIKDRRCLWLIDQIIDSAQGLPIGNYTSQWFSNFFLQDLDHFIKEQLKIKYYIRYVDDLVLLGGNKKQLHKAHLAIERFLTKDKLRIKQDWQVFKVDSRAIDFLGFRFFRDKTILRKRNALRISRRMRKISKKAQLNYTDACAVISYWGWIKRSDSYHFYLKYVKPHVSIGLAKKIISNYTKTAVNNPRRFKP